MIPTQIMPRKHDLIVSSEQIANGRNSFISGRIFVALWCVLYAPFFTQSRALFLHHYLPASCMSILLFAIITAWVMEHVLRLGVVSAHAAAGTIVMAAMYAFVMLVPFSLGTPLSSNDDIKARQWIKTWDIITDFSPQQ